MNDSIFTDRINSILTGLVTQMLEQLAKQKANSTSKVDPNLTGLSQSNTTAASGSFAEIINQVSGKYGVNPALVNAVIKAESNYDADAVSSAGALGLMQLMPGTASGLGVTNPLDPAQNIDGGVRFLSGLLKRYDGDVKLALAAYNAGPGAVDKYGGIPPYQETQVYVQRVLGYYKSANQWSG